MNQCVPELLALTDSEEQCKHCYACFGLAVFVAQMLEQELENLWVSLCVNEDRSLTGDGWDAFEATFSKDTLGRMWRKVSEKLQPPRNLKHLLEDALGHRNALVHGYWARRGALIGSPEGRLKMCIEFQSNIDVFQRADAALQKYTKEFRRALGITD